MLRAPFRDRKDAGQKLARALERFRGADVLVLGLPRGGVPVAFEVAKALGAELDIIVVRKLAARSQPEFGVGAIARNARVVDEGSVRAIGLDPEGLADVERTERAELERRERAYLSGRAPARVSGRTVILVDDGVATGVSARAALRSIRARSPQLVVFAAPVGPRDAREALADEADEIILLETPSDFRAVGVWYDDFAQTSDDEVLDLLAQARAGSPSSSGGAGELSAREVRVRADPVDLDGTLSVPPDPLGLVIFAHGSGSSRFSPRNRYVASVLQQRGLATLLLDLLTPGEERVDLETREHRFDIALLARRLVETARWARIQPTLASLPIAYFGSSTGGGAALVAAAELEGEVSAVVSRGGRPDLAGDALPRVRAPTLLLVGERDPVVIELNKGARDRMRAPVDLRIVPRAGHLFEGPGELEEVAGHAADFLASAFMPEARKAHEARR